MQRIEISPSFYIGLAVMLLVLPIKLVIAILLAAVIHEFWHILASLSLHIPIHGFTIHPQGMELITAPMTYGQELIVSLAGPLGGASVLLFARHVPIIALCAIAQSIFNLMPVYPLDGGRALRCMSYLLFKKSQAPKICAVTEKCVLAVLVLLCLLTGIHLKLYAISVLATGLCVYKLFYREKLLAKRDINEYNMSN